MGTEGLPHKIPGLSLSGELVLSTELATKVQNDSNEAIPATRDFNKTKCFTQNMSLHPISN